MDNSIPLGTVLGERWRITGVLGSGGFGQVYSAEDTSEVSLGQAAVKVLHPNTSPQERASFLSEVQKIAQLRHQNLVGYLDSGQSQFDNGDPRAAEIRPYLVAELCDGSLDQWIREAGGKLDPDDLLVVLEDMVAGLAHLHDRGMIHRDIKPANVLYADGSWKLADFGLMRDLSATGTYHRGDLLIGTPIFMAPELFSTMSATPPSDIYAIGVLTHLAGTGRPLHAGAGPALAHNITTTAAAIDPGLDPDVAEIVAWTTSFDPEQRPDVHQLADLVGEMLNGGGATAPPSPTHIAVPPPVVPGSGPGPGPPVSGNPVPAAVQAHSTPPPTPSPLNTYPPASVSPVSGLPASPPIQALSAPPPAGAPSPAATYPPPSGAAYPQGPAVYRGIGHQPAVAGYPPGVGPVDPLRDGPAPASGGRSGLLATLAVAAVFVLVAGAAGAYLLGRDTDGGSASPGPEVAAPDATTEETAAPSDEPIEDDSLPAAPSDGGEGIPLADPIDHVVSPVCVDGVENQVEVLNISDTPVEYRMELAYRNEAGAVINSAFDTVTAVPPGKRALLDMAPTMEESVSCTVSSFRADPVEQSLLDDIEHAELLSCALDDFFSDWYNYAIRFTNPTQMAVDADVTVGLIDGDGLLIDEGFSTNLRDVAPGDVAQTDDNSVFGNISELDTPTDDLRCVIVAVEIDDAF